MDEQHILNKISALVEEEQELREKAPASPPDWIHSPEHARLTSIEGELDQCWDLLRQRRAKRQYGENPDEAEPRSVRQVENYES
ncbi:hypothetical protein BJG92_01050 [Arthrobacter sp. SO5]|uniref:DUF2630 family protein n=1 Tax=Arthrobacter sp. SO5 TaxID=1897055 RepID=UPI001E2C87AE|nr:DUF2630 family protein [Arthrobacter sp. SO5]MCB5273528.1 hypothetical protein [Arthrobacter sp. SO5]